MVKRCADDTTVAQGLGHRWTEGGRGSEGAVRLVAVAKGRHLQTKGEASDGELAVWWESAG